ncbi:hypothetical protein scyTo_0021653, partial [Scyliorhinus torazame]|nr:hypothetical protein [Scyliorhinus torazame]
VSDTSDPEYQQHLSVQAPVITDWEGTRISGGFTLLSSRVEVISYQINVFMLWCRFPVLSIISTPAGNLLEDIRRGGITDRNLKHYISI